MVTLDGLATQVLRVLEAQQAYFQARRSDATAEETKRLLTKSKALEAALRATCREIVTPPVRPAVFDLFSVAGEEPALCGGEEKLPYWAGIEE